MGAGNRPLHLPSVDVIAGDKSAFEEGLDTGSFTIVRSGDTTAALNVRYELSGTARPGSDYVSPPASIIIPAGQVAATITITPRVDDLTEGDETVQLTLRTNAGYKLGPYTNAAVQLHDGGFGRWRGSWFTPEEILNNSVSGETADPDGDGLSNLLEFFHGTDPKNSDTAPRLRLAPDVSGWSVNWERHQDAAGLYLRLEQCSNVGQWSPAPFSGASCRTSPTVFPTSTCSSRIANPTTNGTQRFLSNSCKPKPISAGNGDSQLFLFVRHADKRDRPLYGHGYGEQRFLGNTISDRAATVIDSAGGGGRNSVYRLYWHKLDGQRRGKRSRPLAYV